MRARYRHVDVDGRGLAAATAMAGAMESDAAPAPLPSAVRRRLVCRDDCEGPRVTAGQLAGLRAIGELARIRPLEASDDDQVFPPPGDPDHDSPEVVWAVVGQPDARVLTAAHSILG